MLVCCQSLRKAAKKMAPFQTRPTRLVERHMFALKELFILFLEEHERQSVKIIVKAIICRSQVYIAATHDAADNH